MKSGDMTGARACMQAQPARVMGSMQARTVSTGRRGVLRRHVVGSAALAVRKEHAKCAVPQPAKTHVKCEPGATAGVIRSIAMSFVQLARCRDAISNGPAPPSSGFAPFFLVCEHAKCAQEGAVLPSPGVIAIVREPSACATASSVYFSGDAAGRNLRLEEDQHAALLGVGEI